MEGLGFVLMVVGASIYISNRKKLLSEEPGLTPMQILGYFVLGTVLLSGAGLYFALYASNRLPYNFSNSNSLLLASGSLALSVMSFISALTGRKVLSGGESENE